MGKEIVTRRMAPDLSGGSHAQEFGTMKGSIKERNGSTGLAVWQPFQMLRIATTRSHDEV